MVLTVISDMASKVNNFRWQSMAYARVTKALVDHKLNYITILHDIQGENVYRTRISSSKRWSYVGNLSSPLSVKRR